MDQLALRPEWDPMMHFSTRLVFLHGSDTITAFPSFTYFHLFSVIRVYHFWWMEDRVQCIPF